LVVAASGVALQKQHASPRHGDVRHSLASINAAQNAFGFKPTVILEEGLQEYMTWFKRDWKGS
jgi:UDP-glucose 4-epimerase